MTEWLTQLLGETAATYTIYITGGIIVLVALWMVWSLSRRIARGIRLSGNRRRPRLSVIEAATVDGKRRVVLVRRDEVEHLVMIGGQNDFVIESGIGKTQGEAAQGAPARDRRPRDPAVPAARPRPAAAPAPRPATRRQPVAPETPDPKVDSRPAAAAATAFVRREPDVQMPPPAAPVEPEIRTPAPVREQEAVAVEVKPVRVEAPEAPVAAPRNEPRVRVARADVDAAPAAETAEEVAPVRETPSEEVISAEAVQEPAPEAPIDPAPAEDESEQPVVAADAAEPEVGDTDVEEIQAVIDSAPVLPPVPPQRPRLSLVRSPAPEPEPEPVAQASEEAEVEPAEAPTADAETVAEQPDESASDVAGEADDEQPQDAASDEAQEAAAEGESDTPADPDKPVLPGNAALEREMNRLLAQLAQKD
ncbi:flagellar biosynthetic protein FliO [Oricola sp.]|uniref:flagellar biosynthetic protein FliO n=1 Tax=Oricola sp. TaxID=1979950 RepID=UPI0025F75B13|nr:flagellar biosynthetic protein FliO [Oricola sp.]MCI5077259.1 flagellar biosynthetic protein FliO [Oricola sp.]